MVDGLLDAHQFLRPLKVARAAFQDAGCARLHLAFQGSCDRLRYQIIFADHLSLLLEARSFVLGWGPSIKRRPPSRKGAVGGGRLYRVWVSRRCESWSRLEVRKI
jgi:hypothetical protein